MAGFTPFQFSSKKLQDDTIGGTLGIKVSGGLGDILSSAFSWYEMWINPG